VCRAFNFSQCIAEYGEVDGADKIAAEIYARGPIACGVNANAGPLVDYNGGIVDLPQGSTKSIILFRLLDGEKMLLLERVIGL
jgi:hypothetical protein